ncbi:MAG: glycosyltransferase [Ignavibacteriales bacterium]|nr:glycosyltransferase [Ignavibacteriales bacterium]
MGNKPGHIDISVIIVNYNVRDFLYHALHSLYKASKRIRTEIIVVDNASDDGSVEMVRKRFPAVQLIPNKNNLGFAKANNIALKRARGKFLLLINPDTVVQEDTLSVMMNFFAEYPDAGLAGCKVLNPDGTFQLSCRRSFPTPWVALTKMTGLSKLFPRSSWFGKYNLTFLNTEETYEVDAVSGSFMMLRREIYERVGGLDEAFFMYGEDLDWCYRIQSAGWKVYYVHSTKIIHYKGESTKRSGLDEIRTFYEAMHLFVRKHLKSLFPLSMLVRSGIVVTSIGAVVRSSVKPLKFATVDFLIVDATLLVAEYIWRGGMFQYPGYAYPIVFVVPAVIVVSSLYAAGVYTHRNMSVSRSLAAVVASYVVIASLTALFKQYAFSRMIMGISGILSVLLIPAWRIILKLSGRVATTGRKSLLGKRTLIVGTDRSAKELLKKLRARVGEGYDIVGFVDRTRRHVGESIDGVSIVGSIENIGKVIREFRVSDVIFSTDALSYAEILSVIGRIPDQAVNFHLVPTTLEVIIGKASVDTLEEIPLVQISYNIEQPFHKASKRVFDVTVSALLFIFVYPILRVRRAFSPKTHSSFVLSIPSVLKGERSLVGPPVAAGIHAAHNGQSTPSVSLGKPGLTGLVQLQGNRSLTSEEVEQYNLYYARNQSVLLDLEILIKTWLQHRMN